jgi:hypothetical protein
MGRRLKRNLGRFVYRDGDEDLVNDAFGPLFKLYTDVAGRSHVDKGDCPETTPIYYLKVAEEYSDPSPYQTRPQGLALIPTGTKEGEV